MRRHATFVIPLVAGALALLAAAPSLAQDGKTLLGSVGEVYTVQRGSYGALFADPPAGSGSNAVLALDVLKDGKVSRRLVPGTDGPEDEQDAVLALDTVGNRVYVVWQADRVFTVAGFGAGGWQQPVELAGDAASVKRNPQLATSVVRSQKLDAEGHLVAVSRTFLHLVYHEDGGGAGTRLVYTAAAIEGNTVVPATAGLRPPRAGRQRAGSRRRRPRAGQPQAAAGGAARTRQRQRRRRLRRRRARRAGHARAAADRARPALLRRQGDAR